MLFRYDDCVFAQYSDCLIRLSEEYQEYFAGMGLIWKPGTLTFLHIENNPLLSFYWNCVMEQITNDHVGFLYLIRCRELYKIGVTSDFQVRRRKYVTECPHPFDTIFAVPTPGNDAIERLIKAFFASKQHRGEWFRFSDSEVRLLKRIARAAYEDNGGFIDSLGDA